MPVHRCLVGHNSDEVISIVSQLASLLDLNTLHDLSRTCRQFRANLLQYRKMLKALTLRCQNEFPEVKGDLGQDAHASSAARMFRLKKTERITSGKVGPCARDMVGECRKCSNIVCRVRIRLVLYLYDPTLPLTCCRTA